LNSRWLNQERMSRS